VTARDTVVDVGRGIELCHDQTGDPADPPILLIACLGQQLHSWPGDFVVALVPGWGPLISDHTTWAPITNTEPEEQA
jgi:hypothetical protein